MMNKLWQELSSFYLFIKHPAQNFKNENSNYSIIELTFRLFLMIYAFNILSVIVKVIGLSFLSLLIPESTNQVILWKHYTSPIMPIDDIMVSILIAPVLEEMGFRLGLVLRPAYMAISIGTLCYIFSPGPVLFFSQSFWLQPAWWLRLGGGITVGAACYWIFKRTDRLPQLGRKHYAVIFYMSVLIFGFIHLLNQSEMTLYKLIIAPVAVFIQITSGAFFGYIRVRYGFWQAVTIHILNNAPVAIGYLI